MPGNNHHPWCSCGWCTGGGGGGGSWQPQSDSPRRILEQANALNCWTSCFIEPNAKCPICGASVYYYENIFGSKVYFDELGWPWPKHPCTDNAQPSRGEPLRFRSHADIKKILSAHATMGDRGQVQYKKKYGKEPPVLYQVVEIFRSKYVSAIGAIPITSGKNNNPEIFSCTKQVRNIFIGDFFSHLKHESLISYLERKSGEEEQVQSVRFIES